MIIFILSPKPIRLNAMALSVFVIVLSACAEVRQLTYPDNFVYLGKSEISTLMFSLMDSMIVLDELEEKARDNPTKSAAILAELEKIEALTNRFSININEESSGGLEKMQTNHLLLDEHIDEFINDVAAAKLQMKTDPPNYYVVGRLTGGCNSCHRRR